MDDIYPSGLERPTEVNTKVATVLDSIPGLQNLSAEEAVLNIAHKNRPIRLLTLKIKEHRNFGHCIFGD
jgi:hypothetical protein